MQIQTLIAEGAGTREEWVIEGSNTGSNIKVTKPPVFNREIERVEGFIMACKLYLRMKIRKAILEE